VRENFPITGVCVSYCILSDPRSSGLESIRIRVFEIPNYTVKNGWFDMCSPIWINNSVTEQCEMLKVHVFAFIWKKAGGGNMSEMVLHGFFRDLID